MNSLLAVYHCALPAKSPLYGLCRCSKLWIGKKRSCPMNFAKISCVLWLGFAADGAQPKKEKPEPPKPQPAQEDTSENSEWLQAIERLRSQPKPGDVKCAGLNAQLSDIYVFSDDQKKQVAEIRAAYDAELLKRA